VGTGHAVQQAVPVLRHLARELQALAGAGGLDLLGAMAGDDDGAAAGCITHAGNGIEHVLQ
jgi:hypothetical protein